MFGWDAFTVRAIHFKKTNETPFNIPRKNKRWMNRASFDAGGSIFHSAVCILLSADHASYFFCLSSPMVFL